MFKKYTIPFDLDDPKTTIAHHEIILKKPFLKRLYNDWYAIFIKKSEEIKDGKYLEIGSGGGFLKEVFPEVITSDLLSLPNIDMIFNAEQIPFKENEIACIMMMNVFHHIPKPYLFLKEAERTLIKGGKIVLTEPANSAFGRFIYKHFHYEPFDEKAGREISAGHRLSNSNQALPYIYFERDLELFKKEFPLLKIISIKYHSPFSYIISGGVSRTAMLPYFTYNFVKGLEWILSPLSKQIGLFCTIEVEKM